MTIRTQKVLYSAPAFGSLLVILLLSAGCGGQRSPSASYDFGDPASPVMVQLFTDYQCPVCTRFHDEVETELIREVAGDRGFLFRVTPVALLGAESALAGAYALAARDSGRFEEFAALLYSSQEEINSGVYSHENLKRFADGLGMDGETLEQSVRRNDYVNLVAESTGIARALGISGPPSFAVVYDLDGQRRYEIIRGYVSLEVFVDYLDQLEATLGL